MRIAPLPLPDPNPRQSGQEYQGTTTKRIRPVTSPARLGLEPTFTGSEKT